MSLGSGIRNKPIPDPGFRIQGSKRHRTDPDPQHCFNARVPSRTVIAHYALSGQMRSKAHTALTAPLLYIIQGFTNAL
jgi:hypothetical protein